MGLIAKEINPPHVCVLICFYEANGTGLIGAEMGTSVDGHRPLMGIVYVVKI